MSHALKASPPGGSKTRNTEIDPKSWSLSQRRPHGAPTASEQGNDLALAQMALDGNPDAIERLFAAHRKRLFRTACRFLQRREDAEDAVQDALLSAYRNLGSFQGRSLFSTWLTRIVVNAALLRRRHQRSRPELFFDDAISSSAEPVPIAMIDSRPDPEQTVACNETRLLVEEALNDLPPAMQSAFRLRDLQELSNGEAAQASGVRMGAFKSRISRARSHLATRLEPSLVAPLSKSIPQASAGRPYRTEGNL